MKRSWIILLLSLLALASTSAPGQVILFYGRVVDSEGKPIANAEITVLRDNLLVTTTLTSSDGNFQLQLPRGDYVLRIYKLGYQPVYVFFPAIPERGGDIGTIILKKGVEITPEALRFIAKQGDRVPIRLSVVNKGLDPLPVRFYFEAPSGWECRVTTPEGLSINEIYVPPGSSRNLTLIVTIPYNATSSATVRLNAAWADFQETYELRFNVEERRWVILELPYREIVSYPGALTRIPLRVWNVFPSETTFSLATSGPAGWITTIVDPNGVSISRLTLPPGSSRNLTMLLYITPATASGSYKLVVFAASEFAKIAQEVTVNVESKYDLLNLTLPLSRLNMTSGSTASINVVLKNMGNAPTTAFLTVKSQTATIICRFQTTGTSDTSMYILPGEEKMIPLAVEVLPGTQASEYLVTLTATGSVSKVEKSMVIRVEGSKALEVSSEKLFTAAAPGATGIVNMHVANRGTVPLNITARAVSAPPKFSVNVAPSSAALQPGNMLVLSVSVHIPSNASEGVYNVALVVEADGLREYRVIVVEVASETQLGFLALAIPLAGFSFAAALYSQRRGKR